LWVLSAAYASRISAPFSLVAAVFSSNSSCLCLAYTFMIIGEWCILTASVSIEIVVAITFAFSFVAETSHSTAVVSTSGPLWFCLTCE